MACAGMALAAGAEDITAAAQDTSKIPELVKSLQGQKGSEFAADVISAIAAMPGNPSKKVKKMASASEAFLGSVPDGELASLLANLTANVPFASLPAWVDSFKGAVDAFTKELSDAAYNKLVNDVMAKINKLGDTSDADKTVISAFALKLLARGSTPEEKTDWLKGITIPGAYGKQVMDAAPGVFAGNYDAVLGPDIEVVKSDDVYIVEPGDDIALIEEAVKTETSPIGMPVIDAATDREGIERPEPLGAPGGTGSGVTSKSKSKSKPSKTTPTPKPPKPPVPPPYDGQF
jgi:hypothetical protein